MRVLVELEGLGDCAYDLRYYHKYRASFMVYWRIRLTGICMMGGDTSFSVFPIFFLPTTLKGAILGIL